MRRERQIYLLPDDKRIEIQKANIKAILTTGKKAINNMTLSDSICYPMPSNFIIVDLSDSYFLQGKINPQFSSATVSILGKNSVKKPYGIGFRRINYREVNRGEIEFTGQVFLEKLEFEGHGIGTGLMMLTDPLIRRIIDLYDWRLKPVIYSLIINQPLQRLPQKGYNRDNWTTSLALKMGYTNDPNILRRYLGPQESPFSNMFIKVYQDLYR